MHQLHQNQRPASRLLLLPSDLPLPKYQFGQQVQWGEQGQDYGIIRGLQYFTPRMSMSICLTLKWVGWWYLVEIDPTCSNRNDLEDVHETDLALREAKPCTT
ncbi:hypothetical protein NDA01_26775 [Trichocoleus desertorum AS-A10]|uniref:hypothetical protein n=1 Tax=Trichocoleus desertorum TaxID=1481672 RepID=UPI003299F34A